jgi:hypothetical protein
LPTVHLLENLPVGFVQLDLRAVFDDVFVQLDDLAFHAAQQRTSQRAINARRFHRGPGFGEDFHRPLRIFLAHLVGRQ